ncbi:MAG: hypothetical protein B1H40_02945 [Candidatus Latescibacteria bacterium 4484_181]|nr:MAG: hypothetical protein B1H40_02945 [Candidatus Latescibacteria bacterium 4484_181]
MILGWGEKSKYFGGAVVLILLFPIFCLSSEPGRIVGQVTDASTGQPLVGATVWVEPLNIGTTTDSSGRFAIEKVPPGTYQLRGHIIGYSRISKRVRIEAAETVEASLAMSPVSFRLKDVVVTAEKEKLSEAEHSQAFVTVIKAKEFESKAVSLPEVLAGTAGVQVKTLGGLGSYSTVSVRGTSAQQVRVYLDGVALNSALGGGVNLGNIPLSNVERIEVYKGTIPAKFGGSGLGGVVHIITKRTGATVGGCALKGGGCGTRQTSTFFSGKHKDFKYLTAIDYTESDNDFPFLDDNGTRYNKRDDQWKLRQNNGFRSFNLIGKIDWSHSGRTELSVNNNFCWSYKGIPGRGSFQAKFARLKVIRNLTEFSFLRRRFLKYGWTLGLKGFNSYYASDYRDLKAEVGLGRQDNHNVTRTYGGEISLKSIVGQHQVWSLLLKWKQERFLPSDRLHHEQLFESRRRSYSLAAEDEMVLLREKLSCILSLRQESYQSRFYGDYTHGHWVRAPARKRSYRFLSYRLGVKYNAFTWLIIKGNIGKYYRVPSFYELFGDKGATIGNTGLEPERGLSRDIGFRITIGHIGKIQETALEVAHFDNRLDNLIQFIQHSQMTSRPENIGKAHIRGLEVTGKMDFLKHLRVEGNLTYQQALNRSELYGGIYYGKLLPNKAKWETNIRATFFSKDYGEIFYDYSYTDKNFHDLYNKVPINRRIIHNVGFTVVCPWRQQLRSTFEAKNLTNTQVADMWGYPLPGRSYYVTINGTF